MDDRLHSRKDDELEKKDQGIFSRTVLLAGIALLVLFGLALLLVRHAGRHVEPVNPDSHPTSRSVTSQTERWVT
jgi:hypothetical protein